MIDKINNNLDLVVFLLNNHKKLKQAVHHKIKE